MKKYIIALILINASLFAQPFSDIEFFYNDTTGTSWEGSLKGDLYYTNLNGTTQYWSKTTPELELMGTYSLSETFSDGDYNGWTVSSGSYAVVDSVGYSGLAKSLRCATAGIISIPCNQAYGYWAFDWKKGADGNDFRPYIISSLVGEYNTGNLGYYIATNSNEAVGVLRSNGSSVTTLSLSASAYITNFTTYRDSIVRNTNGSFSVYIKGGTFGDTYTLVSTTGGSGTNPVTGNTYTQSNYFVLDLDAGDMIANIQCEYGMGSLDLNGHEMVKYPYQNSSFEGADTTYFAGEGTYIADTTSQRKYAGSYSMKIKTGGGADGTKPQIVLKIGDKVSTSDTIAVYANLFEKPVFNFQATVNTVGQDVILYVLGVGDSTTNRVKLSASMFTPLVVGEKYTVEYWTNAWGTDSLVVDNFSITQAKDLMVNVWVNKNLSSSAWIINKGLAGTTGINPGYEIFANSTTTSAGIKGAAGTAITRSSTMANSQWVLFTVKYDRTGNMIIYKNADSVVSISITSIDNITNNYSFFLGCYNTTGDKFTGKIGETQMVTFDDISTVDKTPAQIYQRGKNRVHMYDAYTGGTIQAWFFKDATANDASGNGNNLTGTGSPSVSTLTTSY